MQDRFCLQRSQSRHLGDEPSEQRAHDRRGETASRYFLSRMIVPRQSYIHAARGKLDEMTGLIEEGMVFIEASHVRRDDTGKVTGPFRGSEIVVITCGNDMDALEVGFVYPLFVLEDVFRQAASVELSIHDRRA